MAAGEEVDLAAGEEEVVAVEEVEGEDLAADEVVDSVVVEEVVEAVVAVESDSEVAAVEDHRSKAKRPLFNSVL